MPNDRVLAELRAVREAYAARFGFDPVAMCRDLREREQEEGRVVLAPPNRTVTPEQISSMLIPLLSPAAGG